MWWPSFHHVEVWQIIIPPDFLLQSLPIFFSVCVAFFCVDLIHAKRLSHSQIQRHNMHDHQGDRYTHSIMQGSKRDAHSTYKFSWSF